jgi:hypothetical protein
MSCFNMHVITRHLMLHGAAAAALSFHAAVHILVLTLCYVQFDLCVTYAGATAAGSLSQLHMPECGCTALLSLPHTLNIKLLAAALH